MGDKPKFEQSDEMEKALKALFHQPEPDPDFVKKLEQDLLRRTPRRSWRDRLFNSFSSLAPTLAWGAAALVFCLALVWTLDTLIPRKVPSALQALLPASPTPTMAVNSLSRTATSIPTIQKTPGALPPSDQAPASTTSSTASAAAPSSPAATPTPSGVAPTFTPDLGKLVYLQGGNIWLKQLPSGASVRLTKDGLNSQPRISHTGRWLAFRKGRDEVWVMSVDGQTAYMLNNGKRVSLFDWSPLRDSLVYVAGDGELRLTEAGSSKDLRILLRQSNGKTVNRVAWSPAGDWIAYQLTTSKASTQSTTVGLYKIATDGDGPILLYSGNPLLAGWTGNGRSLLFWEAGPIPSASILADGIPLEMVPANGGTPQVLAKTVLPYEDFVRPDPSGSARVAVVSGGPRETWSNKTLFLFDNGNAAQLAGNDIASSSPAWSPDGQEIAYASAPGIATDAGRAAEQQAMMQRHLWLRSFQTRQTRPLTSDPAYRDEYPVWSMDGSALLFVRVDAQNQVSLWLLDPLAGSPVKVVDGLQAPAGFYGHVDWSSLFNWQH